MYTNCPQQESSLTGPATFSTMPGHSSQQGTFVDGVVNWRKSYTCEFCTKVFSKSSTCRKHKEQCTLKRVAGIVVNGNAENPSASLCSPSEIDRNNFENPSPSLCSPNETESNNSENPSAYEIDRNNSKNPSPSLCCPSKIDRNNGENPSTSLCSPSEIDRNNSENPSASLCSPSIDRNKFENPSACKTDRNNSEKPSAGSPLLSTSTVEKSSEDKDLKKPAYEVRSDRGDNMAIALSNNCSQSDMIMTQTADHLTHNSHLQAKKFPHGIRNVPVCSSLLHNHVDKVSTRQKSRTCHFCNTVFARPATCRTHMRQCHVKQVSSSLVRDVAENSLVPSLVSTEPNSENVDAASQGSGTSTQSPLVADIMAGSTPAAAGMSMETTEPNNPDHKVHSDGEANVASALANQHLSSSKPDMVKMQTSTSLTCTGHLEEIKFLYGISALSTTAACNSYLQNDVDRFLTWRKSCICDCCNKVFASPVTCRQHKKRCRLKHAASTLIKENARNTLTSVPASSVSSRVNADSSGHAVWTSGHSPLVTDMAAGSSLLSTFASEMSAKDDNPNKPVCEVPFKRDKNTANALPNHRLQASQSDLVKTQTADPITINSHIKEEKSPYGISGVPNTPADSFLLQNDINQFLTWRKTHTCDVCHLVFSRPLTCRKHKKRCRMKLFASSRRRENAGNALASLSTEVKNVNTDASNHWSETPTQFSQPVDMMTLPAMSPAKTSVEDDNPNKPASDDVHSDEDNIMASALANHHSQSPQSHLVNTQTASIMTYTNCPQEKFPCGISMFPTKPAYTSHLQNVDKALIGTNSRACKFCNKVYKRPATCRKHEKRCGMNNVAGSVLKDKDEPPLASSSASSDSSCGKSETLGHLSKTSSQSPHATEKMAGFPNPTTLTAELSADDDGPNKPASEVHFDGNNNTASAPSNHCSHLLSQADLIKPQTAGSLTYDSHLQEDKTLRGISGASTTPVSTSQPLNGDLDKVLEWRKSRTCIICNKVFAQPSILRRHKQRCPVMRAAGGLVKDNAEHSLASLFAASEPGKDSSDAVSKDSSSSQPPPLTTATAGSPHPSTLSVSAAVPPSNGTSRCLASLAEAPTLTASQFHSMFASSAASMSFSATALSLSVATSAHKSDLSSTEVHNQESQDADGHSDNANDKKTCQESPREVRVDPPALLEPVTQTAAAVAENESSDLNGGNESGNSSEKECPQPMMYRNEETHKNQKQDDHSVCEKRYAYKKDMKSRRDLHAVGEPYQCPICFAKFHLSSSLKRHSLCHKNNTAWDLIMKKSGGAMPSRDVLLSQTTGTVRDAALAAATTSQSQESPPVAGSRAMKVDPAVHWAMKVDPAAHWAMKVDPAAHWAMKIDPAAHWAMKVDPGRRIMKVDSAHRAMNVDRGRRTMKVDSAHRTMKVDRGRRAMKADPARRAMKARPARRAMKTDPARRAMKADPARRAMKVDPARRAMKVYPARRAMKVDPARRTMKADPAVTVSMSTAETAVTGKKYEPRAYSLSNPSPQNLVSDHSGSGMISPSVTQTMSQASLASPQFLGSPGDFLFMVPPFPPEHPPQSDVLDLSKSNTKRWRKSSSFPRSDRETAVAPLRPTVSTCSASVLIPASSRTFLSWPSGVEGRKQQGSQELNEPLKEAPQGNDPSPRRRYQHKRKASIDETIEHLMKRKGYRKTAVQSPSQDPHRHECTPRSLVEDLDARKDASQATVQDMDNHQTMSQSPAVQSPSQDLHSHECSPRSLNEDLVARKAALQASVQDMDNHQTVSQSTVQDVGADEHLPRPVVCKSRSHRSPSLSCGFSSQVNLCCAQSSSVSEGEAQAGQDIQDRTHSGTMSTSYRHGQTHDCIASLVSSGRLFRCKHCDCYFTDYNMRMVHMGIHMMPDRPFVCMVCRQDCYNKTRLSQHLLTHLQLLSRSKSQT